MIVESSRNREIRKKSLSCKNVRARNEKIGRGEKINEELLEREQKNEMKRDDDERERER